MRKLLNNPWIVSALAVAAVAFAAFSLRSPKPNYAAAAAAAASSETAGEPSEETAAPAVGNPAIVAALKELSLAPTPRDPFGAGIGKTDAVSASQQVPQPDVVDTLHLSAIWTQSGVTLVLLNDRICQAGDRIAPFKIDTASQDGVWVTHWKGRDFVRLGQDFTLVTPAKDADARAAM